MPISFAVFITSLSYCVGLSLVVPKLLLTLPAFLAATNSVGLSFGCISFHNFCSKVDPLAAKAQNRPPNTPPIVFSVAFALRHSDHATPKLVVANHSNTPRPPHARVLTTGLAMVFTNQSHAHQYGNVGTVDNAKFDVVSHALNAQLSGLYHCLLKLASSSHFTNSWKPCTFSLALSAHTKSNAHDTKLVPKVLTDCFPIHIR